MYLLWDVVLGTCGKMDNTNGDNEGTEGLITEGSETEDKTQRKSFEDKLHI